MNTHLVYRKQFFVKGVIYILICLLLGIIATYIIKSKAASIVLLCLMIMPIFFLQILMKLFIKEALIGIHVDSIILTIFDRKETMHKTTINFNDVVAYSIQLPTLKTADIKFYLKNGKSLSYSFSTAKKNAHYADGKEVITIFQESINKFNRLAPGDRRIFLRPSFYASTKGLTVIVILSILLIAAVLIVSSIKGISSLPLSFLFTGLIIFQLLIKRKRELNYFNVMKKDILK